MQQIGRSRRTPKVVVIVQLALAPALAQAQAMTSAPNVENSPTTPVEVTAPPAPVGATESQANEPQAVRDSGNDSEAKGDAPKKKKKRKKAAAQRSDEDDISIGDPWGDSRGDIAVAGMSFRFLAQAQYRHTFASTSTNSDPTYRTIEKDLVRDGDGWDLNRMFFRIMAEPSRYLGLKLVTDFSEFRHNNPKRAIKQAYVELRPLPKHLHVIVGYLKVPFEIFELDAVSKFEFASFGQTNEMLNDLGFSGRDAGAELVFSPLAKPRYLNVIAGAFRGHATGDNGSFVGAVGARVESEFIKGYRVGAGWLGHPQRNTYYERLDTSDKDLMANPADPNSPRGQNWNKGNAFGADVTFNRSGFMLRGEGLIGDRVDLDTRYGAKRWASIWGIAAYKFPAGPVQLQPALKCEVLDTDLAHSSGRRNQYSFALSTFFGRATRLMLDVTRTQVQDNSPVVDQPSPLRETPYNDLSNTRVTAQIQVVL